MRELFVSNELVCKGNNPRPAVMNDWPEWELNDGTRARIPGSFVRTVSDEDQCKTNRSTGTATFTSDEIEVRIMAGQDPTNEDIGALRASVRSYVGPSLVAVSACECSNYSITARGLGVRPHLWRWEAYCK